jgi:trehalose-6-phosphatase
MAFETKHGLLCVDLGEYTPEELGFLKAMDEYIRRKRRKFPSFVEVLNVAKSLGYRKQEDDDGAKTEAEQEAKTKREKADKLEAWNRKRKDDRRKAGNERARRK